jgi:hypothetical protein
VQIYYRIENEQIVNLCNVVCVQVEEESLVGIVGCEKQHLNNKKPKSMNEVL